MTPELCQNGARSGLSGSVQTEFQQVLALLCIFHRLLSLRLRLQSMQELENFSKTCYRLMTDIIVVTRSLPKPSPQKTWLLFLSAHSRSMCERCGVTLISDDSRPPLALPLSPVLSVLFCDVIFSLSSHSLPEAVSG